MPLGRLGDLAFKRAVLTTEPIHVPVDGQSLTSAGRTDAALERLTGRRFVLHIFIIRQGRGGVMQPNGQGAIPLKVPNLQKAQLGHFYVKLRDEVRDYLVTGYQVDGTGNLHLMGASGVAASIAAGQWLEVTRPDIVPEVVE